MQATRDDVALWREADILGDERREGVFRVSRSYFRGLVREGKFPPPIKHGKLSFWRKADVLSALSRIAEGAT